MDNREATEIPPGRRWTDEALWREFQRLGRLEGDLSTVQHAVFGYPDDSKTGLLRRVGATEDDVAGLDTKIVTGLSLVREEQIALRGEVESNRRTTRLLGAIALVLIPTLTTAGLHFIPPG